MTGGPAYSDVQCHRGRHEDGGWYCVGHGQSWPCIPPQAEQQASQAGIYENPATPGFHLANVGGGIAGLGSFVSLCRRCASLVANTDNAREVHRAWHDGIEATA